MQLAQSIFFSLAFFQVNPPRVPPNAGDGEGATLIFILLVGATFFVIAGIVIAGANAVLKTIAAPEAAQVPVFIAAVLISGATIWFFWDTLRELLSPIAEWSWTGLLLLFSVLAVCVFIAVIVGGLRSSLSRENLAGTISLLLVAVSTTCLYTFASWGFWSALGVSFGGITVLNVIGVLIWKFVFDGPQTNGGQ